MMLLLLRLAIGNNKVMCLLDGRYTFDTGEVFTLLVESFVYPCYSSSLSLAVPVSSVAGGGDCRLSFFEGRLWLSLSGCSLSKTSSLVSASPLDSHCTLLLLFIPFAAFFCFLSGEVKLLHIGLSASPHGLPLFQRSLYLEVLAHHGDA